MFARANKWIALLLSATLSGCASITPPSGGEADKKPPKLVKSSPATGSTSVNPRTIVLEFDEQVDVNDIQNQLVISPLSGNEYETDVDKDKIEIKLKEQLLPNTTYSFNFRESVKDLTEGNKAVMEPLVFSTGPVLDSGQIKGIVKSLLTQTPESGMQVLLFYAGDTAAIRNGKPAYITTTDAQGQFNFRYLPEKKYQLLALKDLNKDLKYNEGIEKRSLNFDTISTVLRDSAKFLYSVKYDTKFPVLLKKTPFKGGISLSYSEGLSTFRVIPQNSNLNQDSSQFRISQDGKTIRVFIAKAQDYTLHVESIDSTANSKIDTIQFTGTLPEIKKLEWSAVGNTEEINPYPVRLTSSLPVKSVNLQQIRMQEQGDSATKKTPIQAARVIYGSELVVYFSKAPASSAQIILDKGAITFWHGQQNVDTTYTISLSERPVGKLSGSVSTSRKNIIVQLLDEQFKLKQVSKGKKFNFENLDATNYQLRLIEDLDSNGLLSIKKNGLDLETEPIFLSPQPINVRSGWEIESVDIKW